MLSQNEVEAWMELLRELEILEVYRKLYPSVFEFLRQF